MSRQRTGLIFVCGCLAWLLMADASQAQVLGGYGFGYGGLGLWQGLPYGFAQNQQELPYFAKYPPVYYSYPVPRTYGHSPFAYPPGFRTPDVEVAPLQIINPHAPQQQVKPTSDQTAQAGQTPPKVIINPYVDQVQLSVDP
jgi:hypothetical protein